MLLLVGRLVGTAEIRAMFGVGRTQAHNLTLEDDFPRPFDTVMAGRFWLREDVVAWGRAHGRQILGEDDHGAETP